jgi:hypothetical protein
VAASRSLHRTDIDRRLAEACAEVEAPARLDLVLEPESGRVTLAVDDASLIDAVRHPTSPRAVIVFDIADEMSRVYEGFVNRATAVDRPAQRQPGRPRKGEIKRFGQLG